jgi:hypothetical protein
MNSNTKYYTIAGDWSPSLIFNCPQLLGGVGYSLLPKPNDGLVPVSSVESQGNFHNLGHTSDCHSNLLGDKEYGLARSNTWEVRSGVRQCVYVKLNIFCE